VIQRSEVVEKHKKEAKGKEWREELASNSESIIHAEREKVQSAEEHIKELQEAGLNRKVRTMRINAED